MKEAIIQYNDMPSGSHMAISWIPLVRCKDCEHCYFADNRIPCEQENVCGLYGIAVTQDWYCADGRKKDV